MLIPHKGECMQRLMIDLQKPNGTCKGTGIQALAAAARPVEITFGRSQTVIAATPVAVGALEIELIEAGGTVGRPTKERA